MILVIRFQKSGLNRLKIVGYDCEDLKLKMLFKEE